MDETFEEAVVSIRTTLQRTWNAQMNARILSLTKLPGDEFLYLVLVQREKDWVTWWWNDQTKSLSTGHYHQYLHHAIEDYVERLHSGFSISFRKSKEN